MTDLSNLTIIYLMGRLNMLIDLTSGRSRPTAHEVERALQSGPSSGNSKAKGSVVLDKSQQNPI